MNKQLILGKCEVVLKTLKDNSVDAIVTDPPYHLTSIVKRFGKEGSAPAQFGKDGAFARASKGFMGKEWDGGDIAFNVDMWRECLRVLKPGGHLISFSSTRTYHRMAVAIEDAGFEIRDMLEWVYAEGFPKSLNIGLAIDKKNGVESNIIETKTIKKLPTCGIINYEKEGWRKGGYDLEYEKKEARNEFNGFGTALKPAHEPIVLARKPLSEKTIVDNVLKYGTGAIDIDGCRIPSNEKFGTVSTPNFKDVGKKSKEVIGKSALSFGQVQNAERISYEQNSVGRFPANIIVTDDALGQENSRYFDIDIWATRYGLIQIPKPCKKEKNDGCEEMEERPTGHGNFQNSPEFERFNTKNQNFHPTVKPVNLMAWLVKLISKKNDVVLDPFMGSGTTGVACMQLDRNFIGVEMESDYIKIAEARIENEGVKPKQMGLFEEVEQKEEKPKVELIDLFGEGK